VRNLALCVNSLLRQRWSLMAHTRKTEISPRWHVLSTTSSSLQGFRLGTLEGMTKCTVVPVAPVHRCRGTPPFHLTSRQAKACLGLASSPRMPGDGGARTPELFIGLRNHRITDWFGLEGTWWITQLQPPCHGQGPLPPAEGACSKPRPTWP